MESLRQDFQKLQILVLKYMESHRQIVKRFKAAAILEPPVSIMPIAKAVV